MNNIFKITALFIFLATITPFELCAQEKIDVEMLGLDEVVPAKEQPQELVEPEVSPQPEPKPAPPPIILPTPTPVPSPKTESKPEPEPQEQPEKGGIFDRIKSFVDKKTDKEGKKIILKLGPEKEDDKKEDAKKDSKEEEEERLAEEKKARLDRLKEEYLIKISKDGMAVQTEEDLVIPKKKELKWSDSFYRTVDMAPPLISRSRSADNSHIPIIPTFGEKVISLFSTIRTNDISAFNNFYSRIAIPDLRNKKGDTILTYALLLKRHPVVSSILSKGADPDLPNALGHTPLDIAIENLDLKSVKILIDNHANINYIDKYSRTYLMLAARKGYLPIVQLLVEYGADVNASDTYGRTALTIAYRHKKEIVAKYLIKNGAKAWIEKPYERGKQDLIRELEDRWKTPKFNSQ